jgi:hypothetical protein
MLLVSRLYRVLSVQWPGGATGAEEPRVLDLDRPAEVGDRVIDLDAPVPTPRGASAGTAETV